jgi:ABC-2 type transport system permease protein
MNRFNRFFLWLLLKPAAIYRRMGVSVPHLRAILTTKLIMDERRPNSLQPIPKPKDDKPRKYWFQKKKTKKENAKPSGPTFGSLFYTVFMGCTFLFSFYVGKDYITQYSIYFSFYIFILASTLIADFTSVLIDVRDNMIILPKPINDKTFLLGRLLHIIIHISKLVIPLTLPVMIRAVAIDGLSALLPLILMVIATTLFTIFLINALYLFILKVTTPEKFKRIISYFQIFIAIIFYAAYQLIPRLMNKALLEGYSLTTADWAVFFPPYWFAASWQYLATFKLDSPLVIYFVLSLAVPVVSIWAVIKYFAPSFNQKLSMISGSSDEGAAPKKNGKGIVSTTSFYIAFLSKWITEKGTERMAFLHTWKLTSRSRDFKMKVYPSIGYLLVFVVIMFLRSKKLTLVSIQEQSGMGKFVFISILYLSSFTLTMALGQLVFSDKYKAAWIYYITPIQTPGRLFSGALKATIVKFYVPLVALTSIFAIALVGPKIIPHLLFGFFNQVLITAVSAYITMRAFPFSLEQSVEVKGISFIKGLFSMLVPFILAILHYFVYSYLPVIIILCGLSGIASWLMIDALKNRSWDAVFSRSYEH